MSRRHLTYAVVVVASFVVTACADITAPRGIVEEPDENGQCRGGFVLSGGRCVSE